MEDSNRVRAFFDRMARQFDAYYLEERKTFFWKVLDFVLRQSMRTRLKLTLEECKSPKVIKVLDVGCGSGRCAVKILRQGRAVLTGVDFSSAMIKIAQEVVQEYRVQDRCRFILGDFKEVIFAEQFDISVALGFFDYTKDPGEYLAKMKMLTKEKIIASFPARWRLRNLIRIVRLGILRCPVYFYTYSQIEKTLKGLSFKDYTIKSIGRDYFVVATLS